MAALRLLRLKPLFLSVATQPVTDPDCGIGFEHQTHRIKSPTQQIYPVDWWVNLNPHLKERNTWRFTSMTLTHLAWCGARLNLRYLLQDWLPTDNQLLKLWTVRLGCRGSRFISRLWYEHLLSEARQWEWLFPAGSLEYVHAFLRSTWSRQTQPPKCFEFFNPGQRTWSKTCHVTIYHPSEHFKATDKSTSHCRIVFLSQPLQYCRSIHTQGSRAVSYK